MLMRTSLRTRAFYTRVKFLKLGGGHGLGIWVQARCAHQPFNLNNIKRLDAHADLWFFVYAEILASLQCSGIVFHCLYAA